MNRITKAIRRCFQSWTAMDPAVALGLFGTGVGLAVPDYPTWAAEGPIL